MVKKFLQHVLPGVMKPILVLWNEIIGFVFIVLAIVAGGSVVRAWRAFDGQVESVFRLALSGLFALVMLAFGVHSFLRARKISRS